MATLPPLTLEKPRVLGLCARQRLEDAYLKALVQHYTKRGCLVIDMEAYTDPVAVALPLLTSSELWQHIRMELLRGLMYQISQVNNLVVFVNLRTGVEAAYVQDMQPGCSIYHVLTNVTEAVDEIPVVDITQIYPHILDSLL